MGYHIGQEVLATRPHGMRGEPEPLTVRKIGRAYVYAGRDDNAKAWRKFAIDGGYESIPGGYTGGQLYTPQEWADRRQRDDLTRELLDLGVAGTYGNREFHRASVAQLRAIVDVLRGEP